MIGDHHNDTRKTLVKDVIWWPLIPIIAAWAVGSRCRYNFAYTVLAQLHTCIRTSWNRDLPYNSTWAQRISRVFVLLFFPYFRKRLKIMNSIYLREVCIVLSFKSKKISTLKRREVQLKKVLLTWQRAFIQHTDRFTMCLCVCVNVKMSTVCVCVQVVKFSHWIPFSLGFSPVKIENLSLLAWLCNVFTCDFRKSKHREIAFSDSFQFFLVFLSLDVLFFLQQRAICERMTFPVCICLWVCVLWKDVPFWLLHHTHIVQRKLLLADGKISHQWTFIFFSAWKFMVICCINYLWSSVLHQHNWLHLFPNFTKWKL